MKQVEKLDLIKIEDKYNLSQEEILERAMDVALERASMNGWQVSSIKRTSGSPVKYDEYLRYEFEVYGEIISSSKESSSESEHQSSTFPKVAARPTELDL